MKNIVLIGLPASGKSTVAKCVAEELSRALADTDALIEAEAGKSIAAIFRDEGEESFRAREKELLFRLAGEEDRVIATGGGAVLHTDAMKALKKSGLVFYLDRPLQEIRRDMGGAERPLLQGDVKKLEELYRSRDRLYRKAADYVLSGGTVEELTETVTMFAELIAED